MVRNVGTWNSTSFKTWTKESNLTAKLNNDTDWVRTMDIRDEWSSSMGLSYCNLCEKESNHYIQCGSHQSIGIIYWKFTSSLFARRCCRAFSSDCCWHWSGIFFVSQKEQLMALWGFGHGSSLREAASSDASAEVACWGSGRGDAACHETKDWQLSKFIWDVFSPN